jgi:phenylpropionate dioxygenase-like ring-hydroxylating dioxygenase large terminal subunit
VTDNLMDLGHVAFIHRGGLGSASIKDGKHVVQQHGTTLHSNRWCPDGAPSPVWGALFGNYQDNVDHWLNMRWDAPSTMFLDVGVTPAGHDRSEGISVPGTHILTPETETSTHYFWAASRDFALEDDELDIQLRTSIEHAFINEDKPMLEDTQRNMKGRSFDAMRPIILSSDLGAIRARRLLADIRSGRKKQAPSLTEASAALVEG